MGLSINNLRQGHRYFLRNHGEQISFVVIELNAGTDHRIKDIDILEEYNLQDFIRYGIGKDFELYELPVE